MLYAGILEGRDSNMVDFQFPHTIEEACLAWLRDVLNGTGHLFGHNNVRLDNCSPVPGLLRLFAALAGAPDNQTMIKNCFGLLVQEFCEGGPIAQVECPDPILAQGNIAWRNLLELATKHQMQSEDTTERLVELARTFPGEGETLNAGYAYSLEQRYAVLSTLVDINPPNHMDFWKTIFDRSPDYAQHAFSGLLQSDPFVAVGYLPRLPQTNRGGSTSALKISLALDACDADKEAALVGATEKPLTSCNPIFKPPILKALARRREKIWSFTNYSPLSQQLG